MRESGDGERWVFKGECVSDGQRRPPGVPEGRSVVADGRQRQRPTLQPEQQTRPLWERHLLPGLDLPTDEGKKKQTLNLDFSYHHAAFDTIHVEI